MNGVINANRTLGRRDPMIYGHFIEHFHRQIYGGVYDPGNPLSDAGGLPAGCAGGDAPHPCAGAALARRLLRLVLPLEEGRGAAPHAVF